MFLSHGTVKRRRQYFANKMGITLRCRKQRFSKIVTPKMNQYRAFTQSRSKLPSSFAAGFIFALLNTAKRLSRHDLSLAAFVVTAHFQNKNGSHTQYSFTEHCPLRLPIGERKMFNHCRCGGHRRVDHDTTAVAAKL